MHKLPGCARTGSPVQLLSDEVPVQGLVEGDKLAELGIFGGPPVAASTQLPGGLPGCPLLQLAP